MSGASTAAANLPRDVLVNILLLLPASDLRRFRRVCKEWRDVISDPTFIKTHTIKGPRAPTHTVVFVRSSGERTGAALLFDEQWRLTAMFNVGSRPQVLAGTCNGLLCFLDEAQGVVKVVEPYTGESIAMPVPADSVWQRSAQLYCFGYDATAGRYKIVHSAYGRNGHELKVFTVGADDDWRTVKITADVTWYSSSYTPVCNGGAVYWSYTDTETPMYAHFDLATEKITSVERRLVDGCPVSCHHPWWQQQQQRGQPSMIGIRWFAGDCRSNGHDWPPANMNAMAHDVEAINLPDGRRLPRPQALQRGHLLLREENGALYAHRIMNKSVDGFDLGCEKLLMGRPKKGLPVQSRRRMETPPEIYTFAYVPTVAPAPLALHVGAPSACSASQVAQC